jgi:hypothetical protein
VRIRGHRRGYATKTTYALYFSSAAEKAHEGISKYAYPQPAAVDGLRGSWTVGPGCQPEIEDIPARPETPVVSLLRGAACVLPSTPFLSLRCRSSPPPTSARKPYLAAMPPREETNGAASASPSEPAPSPPKGKGKGKKKDDKKDDDLVS